MCRRSAMPSSTTTAGQRNQIRHACYPWSVMRLPMARGDSPWPDHSALGRPDMRLDKSRTFVLRQWQLRNTQQAESSVSTALDKTNTASFLRSQTRCLGGWGSVLVLGGLTVPSPNSMISPPGVQSNLLPSDLPASTLRNAMTYGLVM